MEAKSKDDCEMDGGTWTDNCDKCKKLYDEGWL